MPSSTSTRTSSSGSFQLGTLLDVNRPIKSKQPSPDASTAASTPLLETAALTPIKNDDESSMTVADVAIEPLSIATAVTTIQSSSDFTPRPSEEVQIIPAPTEVSAEVLNEVGLAIDPQSGHVAVLKSPENIKEKAEASLTKAIGLDASVALPIAGIDAQVTAQISEKQVLPPSGQPMPPSSKPQSAVKSGRASTDLKRNPVILIMPGDKKLSDIASGGKDGQVQALIPGGTDLGKQSELDMEIIAQPCVAGIVNIAGPSSTTAPKGDRIPAPMAPSREGSFVDKAAISTVATPLDQKPPGSVPVEMSVASTPAISNQPTALDVLSLMNPKQSPRLTPSQTPEMSRAATEEITSAVNVLTGAAEKVQALTSSPERQDTTGVEPPRLLQADSKPSNEQATPRSQAGGAPTPTVALDGIALDLTTPRDERKVTGARILSYQNYTV